MAHDPPRTHLTRPPLVRLLANLVAGDVAESAQPFAERLGDWLDFKSALALSSVLNGAPADAPPAAPSAESAAVRAALERVRARLAEAITAGRAPSEGTGDFAPYLQQYSAHQREMSAHIAPLRAAARATLARRSPAHKRLATVDAVLDKAIAARESRLLAAVPTRLAKRFAQSPATFHGEMQAVLLAELDLRLQPIQGLIAALDHEDSRFHE